MADRYYVESSYWQDDYAGYQADAIAGLNYYIDEGYYDEEGYYEYRGSAGTLTATLSQVQLADAELNTEFAQTTIVGVIKQGAVEIVSDSTVSCIISHIEGADLSAFTDAQLTAEISVTRDYSAQLNSDSTMEFDGVLIVLLAANLTTEFTQTASADRTRLDSAELSSEFLFLGLPDIITPEGEIKEFSATFATEFTQAQIVELTKDFGSDLYVDAVMDPNGVERIRDADSTQQVEFAQAIVYTKIVQGNIAIDALFAPSMTVNAVRNVFAVLDSTAALAVVANANRSAQIALSSIINQSAQGMRTRDYVVNTSAQTTLTAQVLRIQKSSVTLSTAVTQTVTSNRLAGLTATPSAQFTVSCTATELQGIQLTLFNTASISSTIRINARPPVLFPTRYTGFDTTFQFKFVNSSDRLTVQAMNAVHDDANILRMTSINSDTPEPYSGLPIKLASNISFTNSETKNISLVGGGTGRVAIKSGERFYFKVPNTGTSSIVDNNQYFIANANITDATTSVSVTSAPFGGGNFTTNHQAVSYYFLPNSPLTINVLGPTALGGTGTSRISLSWWSADKETVATPLNRIYNWDLYSTSFRNISASSLNTWHTCRVYASTSTWPNVVLEINGSAVSISPLYQSSLVNYAPYPTVTDANIFGTIDNLDFDTISTGTLVQASSIIQNGTYNSYPQEISSANLSTNFSLSVAPIYVQQAQADLTATATITANVEKTITFEAQLSSAFAQTANARVSYDLTVTINSNSQLTTTIGKITGVTANLTSAFTTVTTARPIKRTTSTLSAQATVTNDFIKYSGNGATLVAESAQSTNNTRIRSTATDISAMASQLSATVKIGRGIVQLDSVATQITDAVKTVSANSVHSVEAEQTTNAVKTVAVDANINASAQLDIVFVKIPSSPVYMESEFRTQINTDLSKITGVSASASVAVALTTSAVKTARPQSSLTTQTALTLGLQVTRIRFAESSQQVTAQLQLQAIKTAQAVVQLQAFNTVLAVGTKISFDPVLQLTIPSESGSLIVFQEDTLLIVPEETRVNMVRKIAI